MGIRPFQGVSPRLHSSVFVADGAQVIGNVEIGEESSVWYNTVLRGDVNTIRLGSRTNIQDLTMIHVEKGMHPTRIGDDVTVGHHVVIHGCTIGSSSVLVRRYSSRICSSGTPRSRNSTAVAQPVRSLPVVQW